MSNPVLRLIFGAYRRRTAFDLDTLSHRFAIPVRGVLHVGANMGQEARTYQAAGAQRVIWIEGFEDYFQQLKAILRNYPTHEAYQLLVSDTDNEEVNFHIASNTGSSTGLVPSTSFADNFSGIVFEGTTMLIGQRIDTYFRQKKIELHDINILGSVLIWFSAAHFADLASATIAALTASTGDRTGGRSSTAKNRRLPSGRS